MPKDEQGVDDQVADAADADDADEAGAAAETEDDPQTDGNGDGDAKPEPFRPPGFLEAAKSILRPNGSRPAARPATGTEADAKAINFIDSRERVVGGIMSLLQVILSVFVYGASRTFVEKPSTKKPILTVAQAHANTLDVHHFAAEYLVVNLVLGLVIGGATLTKRRALVGFTILLGGLGMNTTAGQIVPIVGVVGIAYLGVGLWLVFRSMRRNPSARAARAGGAAKGGGRKGTAAATSDPDDTRSPGERARAAAAAKTAATRAKSASTPTKRYTPPRPTRPAPPKAPQPDPEKESRLMSWLRR